MPERRPVRDGVAVGPSHEGLRLSDRSTCLTRSPLTVGCWTLHLGPQQWLWVARADAQPEWPGPCSLPFSARPHTQSRWADWPRRADSTGRRGQPGVQTRQAAGAALGPGLKESGNPERKESYSWMAHIDQAVNRMWSKIYEPMSQLLSYVVPTLLSIKDSLLAWWMYFWGPKWKCKGNLSVSDGMDLQDYSRREWKGTTGQAQKMIKAYDELFSKHHVKFIQKVRGDNYCAIRSVLYQVFRKGLPFPSWMKETDILKIPERLLFSQGCNWIQQFSFGPEKYAGPNVLVKLRKNLDTLKNQWTEIIGAKDSEEREKMCKMIFCDEDKEYKLYEAIKFLLLVLVLEAHEKMTNGQDVPSFFIIMFARDTSSDPLSFMINHLNPMGDTGGLEQIEMFLLGYALEVKIRVFRLYKVDTEEFQAYYPEEHPREWHEVSLITEDDRHYNIPLFGI